MAKEQKSGGGKFVLGALIGGAIGAVAGLLTAPKSGKETRKDIKDKATEISHEAIRQLRKLEGELNKRISDAKKLVNKFEGNAKTEVESLISRAEKMKDRVIKMADDLKTDTKSQVDDKFMEDVRRIIDDLEELKDHVASRAKNAKK